MTRFFVDGILSGTAKGSLITLTGENAKHAGLVLRLKAGDEVIVCDGLGTDYVCAVERIGRDSALLRVAEKKINENEPDMRVFLFQSLPKSDKMEWITQKAVELGAAAIYPFTAERSVPRPKDAKAKNERLKKIAEAAAKQSGRGVIPKVGDILGFDEAVDLAEEISSGAVFAAHEKAGESMRSLLKGYGSLNTAAVFIGPEGGFSDAETRAFKRAGIKTFSMGRLILRTETAAIASLANIFFGAEGRT